jgi:hypothetical protein
VTLALGDDFAGFVAARWPDLEAVAMVAARDREQAHELTVSALASVGEHWAEAVEEGAPTREARARLLHAVRRLPPGTEPLGAIPPGPSAWGGEDGDAPVRAALLGVLRSERPLVRAGIVAPALWDCSPVETAALAGVPPGPFVEQVDAARSRLRGAHRAATQPEGLPSDDWLFERDLADAIDSLADGSMEPPDPAALVHDSARRVRRRSLLVGGLGVLATGGAAWWLLRDAAPSAAGDPTGPLPDGAAGTAAGDGPVWAWTGRWPPRGSLAGDPGLHALVASDAGAGARLLFAEEVARARVVVAATESRSTVPLPSTAVAVWTGKPGAPAEGLDRVALVRDRIEAVGDVVAVTVPLDVAGGPVAVLVVLTAPTTSGALWSPTVRPTENGRVRRAWTLIALDDGVGVHPLDRAAGGAAHVRVGRYSGPPAGTRAMSVEGLSPLDAATAIVSSATGVPVGGLSSEVVVDSPVGGSVLDPGAPSARGGDGTVQVVHTTTPDNALVRTLHVADDGRSAYGPRLWPSVVLPARDAAAPLLRRLDVVRPRTTRFLVVAPGAATCRMLAMPSGHPASEVTPMKRDTAIVAVVDGEDVDRYRLDLRDADGRRIYSDVPPYGRPLLDLEPA